MRPNPFEKNQSTVLKTKDYISFRKTLAESQCNRCPLSKGRLHIVVDRGNPEAHVVMIGEAPGANEDEQGRAFVGRAGKLLDALMLKEGFDTNRDSLIINVVKCRPPANRIPNQKEVDACNPFFKKQLSLLKPKIIVLLGATALKHIAPEKRDFPMGDQVGKFFTQLDYPGIQWMVFYHPAYILRDPRKKPKMRQHIRYLLKKLRKLGIERPSTTLETA